MTIEPRDISALARRIDDLEIEVSRHANGTFSVCSTSEPLFCYDANTREELATLVEDTLQSYAKHFYGIDGLTVATHDISLPESPIEIDQSTPVSRITFDLAA